MDEQLAKGVLEPKSKEDPQFGRIKKVFLAYVHNPDVYESYTPPYSWEQLIADTALQQRVRQENAQHEEQQQKKIDAHKILVKSFADCLRERGVAVAYDGYFEQERLQCTHQVYEQQIRDSDFVLLIITPSLNYYLEHDPPGKEPMGLLFASKSLYNMMTVQRPPGTHFIPVFLNQEKDSSLIPISLVSSTTYTIYHPFDITTGDLYYLYALLTNQEVNKALEPGPPIQLPKRKRCELAHDCKHDYHDSIFSLSLSLSLSLSPSFISPVGGGVVQSSSMSAQQRHFYANLQQNHSQLQTTALVDISAGLAPQWKLIGEKLGLGPRVMSECEVAAGPDRREACYKMLCRWRELRQDRATVSVLAAAIVATQYFDLLQCLGQTLR